MAVDVEQPRPAESATRAGAHHPGERGSGAASANRAVASNEPTASPAISSPSRSPKTRARRSGLATRCSSVLAVTSKIDRAPPAVAMSTSASASAGVAARPNSPTVQPASDSTSGSASRGWPTRRAVRPIASTEPSRRRRLGIPPSSRPGGGRPGPARRRGCRERRALPPARRAAGRACARSARDERTRPSHRGRASPTPRRRRRSPEPPLRRVQGQRAAQPPRRSPHRHRTRFLACSPSARRRRAAARRACSRPRSSSRRRSSLQAHPAASPDQVRTPTASGGWP